MKTATKAFLAQRNTAKQRGIPFLLTFEEWWDWWQTDNRWADRGRMGHQLVMARHGDVGPYSIENIYCSTGNANKSLGCLMTRSASKAAATRRKTDDFAHLRARATHPRSRAVVSPKGTFPSIALAAEANGVKARYAQQLASKGWHGWRYAE